MIVLRAEAKYAFATAADTILKGGNAMRTYFVSRLIMRRSQLTAVSVVLMVAALGLRGSPAAAQISIGIGMGGAGLGLGGLMSAPQESSSPPSASGTERRAHKTRSSRRVSSGKKEEEAQSKSGSKNDSSSQSKGVDETSFPTH